MPSGTFQGTLSVELATTEAGAEIRYTTDHTPPTATSTLYAGTALSFTATTDLRAQAFVSGTAVGGPAAAVYVARSIEQAHDLPVLVIDTYGTAIPGAATVGVGPGPGVGTGGAGSGTGAPVATERTYVDAALLSLELVDGATSLAAAPQVASPTAIRLRGSSSASYDKKPYRLEFREADGTDRNCPMLGMPRDDDWVLHAPYPDKALIRNAFVYELGRELSIGAPRAQLVELYLSTAATPLSADAYQGVYLLVETVKNHKDRLNLQQLQDTDIALPEVSGGYIFKIEYKVMDIEQLLACPADQTFCWGFLEVADPEPWAPEQQSYLTDFLTRYVNALHSAAPADPTTGYPALMDTQSFVDQVIVNELTRNLDAYTKSQFFHKDRDTTDPLLYAGPLWDYDLIAGVGTSDKYANLALEGWQYEAEVPRYDITVDWFPVLLADPVFHAALVTRWQELRQGVLADAAVTERITRLSAGLAAAAERNFAKWDILTTPMLGFFETPTDATWQGQVDFMNAWLLGRMAWIDTQWQ